MKLRSFVSLSALLLNVACDEHESPTQPRAAERSASTTVEKAQPGEPAASAESLANTVWFEGTCDASGAIALDERRFLVADDEDNVLRVYDAERGGKPLQSFDMSPSLPLSAPDEEADFEAAARIGDHGYFLSSHARKRSGKLEPSRFVFFATTLATDGQSPRLIGRPTTSLLDAIARSPSTSSLRLADEAERAPRSGGGVNIEGLTATVDGGLLIGFRSPVPEGNALLVELTNPVEVLSGVTPRFAEPLRFDLGGLGVRGLSSFRGNYLLMAGPANKDGAFALYRFRTGEAPVRVAIDLAGYSPEAFFTPEGHARVLLLSDDGMKPTAGKHCKKLKDASQKRFRGLWVMLPS